MKILFIAFSQSIHTARWISQISDQKWDIHLFPSIDNGESHKSLKNINIYHSFYGRQDGLKTTVKLHGIPILSKKAAMAVRLFLREVFPRYRVWQLSRLIRKVKPDIIHSMEIQAGGYLALEVKKLLDKKFPNWIVTNWGSDIYLFGRLNKHKTKIKEVLSSCNYYSCECQRDVRLAKEFGFTGTILPVFPNSGGFDIEELNRLRTNIAPSKRKLILLKGYQNWAGRSLVGLRALERCADLLCNYYEIAICSIIEHPLIPESDVKIAAELFTQSTGIPVRIIPNNTPHQEILTLLGQARFSLGLSISDAISTFALEAMAMGSFPIQSCTSCASEWIKDGETGLLVPPNDPDIIEKAIRKTLTDDQLVDTAAIKNFSIICEKLDQKLIKQKIISYYQTVYKNSVSKKNCIKYQSKGENKRSKWKKYIIRTKR
ncbi:MAG: glycosyltransferase family 4 protein [Patescibacteria group bacterium]